MNTAYLVLQCTTCETGYKSIIRDDPGSDEEDELPHSTLPVGMSHPYNSCYRFYFLVYMMNCIADSSVPKLPQALMNGITAEQVKW